MTLVLDVGNSNVKWGLFQGGALVCSGRFAAADRPPEQVRDLLREEMDVAGIPVGVVENVALGTVIRGMAQVWDRVCGELFDKAPVRIHAGMETGVRVGYGEPERMGIDRLAAASAAYAKYGGPIVVVDAGSAITVDAVSGNGELLGGIIAPGPGMSARALHEQTDLLPLVTPKLPDSILGQSTESCIQSGLTYGAGAMVDGLVGRTKEILGDGTRVVGTGGALALILPVLKLMDVVEPHLVLEGLYRAYLLNADPIGLPPEPCNSSPCSA
ncbi:MAG: type III pantothenate kinase [Candidatus Latescibacterota bacterium]